MKRGVLVALAIAVLVLGCARVGTREPQEGWRTGTQGVYMNIVPNLPPPRLYDDQPLEVVVDLENRGAFDVGGPGDKIYLSGFDPNIVTGIPTTGVQIPVLEGKTQFGPGGVGVVNFRGVLRALGFRNVDKYSPRLLLTACYAYETVASDSVCIDPEPFTQATTPKVCTPTSAGMGGSQGAPITVGPVEVEPSPGRTRFKITVTNAGGGEVFRPGGQYLQKCSPYSDAQLEYLDRDYVQVQDVTISGTSIRQSCKPLENGLLRLTKGRGTMFCEYGNIPGNAAFTTPLTVTLRYGYRQIQFREVTILRVS